jgi:SAM-dependent methyltransferase
MTEQGRRAATIWSDRDFARAWAEGDQLRGLLDLPRRISAAVVAGELPAVECVADIGSGPGDYLAVFLEAFPDARGIWTDASEAMYDQARVRLAEFGDRVSYRIADMTDLGDALPAGVDVIVTSRASHHLNRGGLLDFYAAAAGHLAAGGWLVNLDHTGSRDAWEARLRAARTRLQEAAGEQVTPRPGHHHDGPLPTVADHLDGYAAAGLADVAIPWRAFVTCLFMGRRINSEKG